VYILDTASFLPEGVVDNRLLSELTGRDEGYFLQRTGIAERRRAQVGENTNTLAVSAVRALQERHQGWLAEVDLIVGCSYTSWDLIGTIAHAVQRECGLSKARAFTLSSACSSVLNALEVAAAFFDSGRSERALIIAADHNSLHSDDADQRSGHLWGDGAAAMLLSKAPESAAQYRMLDVWTAGLAHLGAGLEGVALRPHDEGLVMPNGRDVFIHACEQMEAAALAVMSRNHLSASDIRLLVPHQANQRIMNQVASRLGISTAQVASTIARFGNTGCASAVISLVAHEAEMAVDDLALMVAFGGGYSSGAALLQKCGVAQSGRKVFSSVMKSSN
jgi:3-oxoacyl-[acyl-carrier-protein] synthase-3